MMVDGGQRSLTPDFFSDISESFAIIYNVQWDDTHGERTHRVAYITIERMESAFSNRSDVAKRCRVKFHISETIKRGRGK